MKHFFSLILFLSFLLFPTPIFAAISCACKVAFDFDFRAGCNGSFTQVFTLDGSEQVNQLGQKFKSDFTGLKACQLAIEDFTGKSATDGFDSDFSPAVKWIGDSSIITTKGCEDLSTNGSQSVILKNAVDASSSTFRHVASCVFKESITNSDVGRSLAELNQFRGLGSGSQGVLGIMGRLINWFIAGTGMVALLIFVYAGILWMTRGANADSKQKAISTTLWTALGLVFLLGSAGIVRWIFERLPMP